MTPSGWKHQYKVTLPAAPAAVFQALTDPSALTRWFAEAVEVEPKPGGAFRFWGRYTYGTPDRETARQQITRFDRDRALGFTWNVDGTETEVALDLTAEPSKDGSPQTAVALQHSFDKQPAGPYGAELVDDLWRLTLGNLDAHLRGGDGILRPDFNDPNPEIRLSIVIDAPREKVFRALLDPESLNKWMAKSAVVDPRVGGVYKLGWKYEVGGREVEGGTTTILDLIENERLVLDWLDWRGDTTRAPSRIGYHLESLGAKTKLTFVHDGFSRPADISDYPFGWAGFLAQFKNALEGRPVTPMFTEGAV